MRYLIVFLFCVSAFAQEKVEFCWIKTKDGKYTGMASTCDRSKLSGDAADKNRTDLYRDKSRESRRALAEKLRKDASSESQIIKDLVEFVLGPETPIPDEKIVEPQVAIKFNPLVVKKPPPKKQ